MYVYPEFIGFIISTYSDRVLFVYRIYNQCNKVMSQLELFLPIGQAPKLFIILYGTE